MQKHENGIYTKASTKEYLDSMYTKLFDVKIGKKGLSYILNDYVNRMNLISKILSELDAKEKKIICPKRNGLTPLVCLYTFLIELENTFGKKFVINDLKAFAQNVCTSFNELSDLKKQNETTRNKTRFKELQGLYMGHEVKERNGMLLGNVQNLEELITKKDSKRCFLLSDQYAKWIEQYKMSVVSQKEISFIDAVGGHIKAHAHGGLTEYKNLAILTKEENARLGTKNLKSFVNTFKKNFPNSFAD
tara:strand:+ start:919 stop:1659 length:741 start_codon:yes stop_codon:yes gene_type:complete